MTAANLGALGTLVGGASDIYGKGVDLKMWGKS
jgi:hypothetical protein